MANTRRNNRRNNRRNRRYSGPASYTVGVVNPLVNTAGKTVGNIAHTGANLVTRTSRGITTVTSDLAHGVNKSLERLFKPVGNIMSKRRNTRRRANRKSRKANRKNRRNTRRQNY